MTEPPSTQSISPTPAADDPGAAPRAALHALGCRLNQAEIDLLARKLEAAGYRLVPWGQPAELCVLNTCTVTGQSDAKSRQALRALRRRQPEATLAVVGCYAELAAERLACEGLADLVVGNAEKLRLPEHLPALEGREGPVVIRPRMTRAPFRAEVAAGGRAAPLRATRAHLKVQDGCDFMCSFCIIPFARGRARPRDLCDLLAEAEALAAAGTRELVLTGVNLGTWAQDGRTLVDVIDALDALPGVARLRISSIEPTTVDPGLLERMADRGHRLVPFLHLPLQSGSDRVLAAMRRRHTAAQYRAFAEGALATVPGLCLGTDVMAGFPGEDAAAFAETVALLEALPAAYCHVFPYSERPGTPATRMAGAVPVPERQRRVAALRRLSDRLRLEFQRRFVGETRAVLFERPKSPGLAAGYTDNYLRVEVPTADASDLRNALLPVTLTVPGDPARPEAMAGTLAATALPLPMAAPRM